jgi:hypothetical protein
MLSHRGAAHSRAVAHSRCQGTKEVGPLCDGSMRKFLKDGDTVIMSGTCTHATDGYKIGFGECSGLILPADTTPIVPPAPPPLIALKDVSLLSYWRSSCSWRVRIALAFYGVPCVSTATLTPTRAALRRAAMAARAFGAVVCACSLVAPG